MHEAEVRKLFLVIENVYSTFVYDDMKVSLWQDLLRGITFDQAQRNLRRYVINPENKFPPHPGILAEKAVQRTEGNYIPDAEETRRMLDERCRLSPGQSHIPESAIERMRQIGYKPSKRSD